MVLPGSTSVKSYRDLIVWQKAMDLIDVVDDIILGFTPYQRFWLGAQMHRASLSIASNIAEGHGADYTKVFLRRLSDAKGSLMELETQLQVVLRRGLASDAISRLALELCAEIGRMLCSLIRKLRAKQARRSSP